MQPDPVSNSSAARVNPVGNAALNNLRLNVYPNPAKDYLNLSFPLEEDSEVKLMISDVMGRVITHQQVYLNEQLGKGTMQLSTSHYQPGIYFISLKLKGKRMVSKKFIVNK